MSFSKQTLPIVSVVGLGYIGLPTAVLIASSGYQVHGIDINHTLLKTIQSGHAPFNEPQLEQLLEEVMVSGQLSVSDKIQPADIYFICVPTPIVSAAAQIEPDLSHVLSAVRQITPLLKKGDTLILESTVPVGTTNRIQDMLAQTGIEKEAIFIAYCPERVIPGNIMHEIVNNDRIVGGVNPSSAKHIADFYRSFVIGEVFETKAKVAEFCKLSENSYRDVNIAFANELSILCENQGVNALEVIALANRHPRVNIMQPGSGVGGHCIAVDPWFLVSGDADYAKLIRKAREVNNNKAAWVFEKVLSESTRFTDLHQREPNIVCCGLTYKPDTDDTRESPALQITSRLVEIYANIKVCEPNLTEHRTFKISSMEQALQKADIVCILVKHKEFLTDNFMSLLGQKRILDFCGATFE